MHMLKQEVADKMKELITPMKGRARRILELGTGWGESAAFMSNLKPNWTIYTVDGFGIYGDGRIYSSFNHDEVKKIIEGLPKNVIQILGDSNSIHWELPIDVLFIDANHTQEACSQDFYNFYGWVTKGGLIIFDDYNQENNPANGVKAAVAEITKHFKVKLIYEGYYCAILKKI
jgi:predicted O-methyltransferase YrrM